MNIAYAIPNIVIKAKIPVNTDPITDSVDINPDVVVMVVIVVAIILIIYNILYSNGNKLLIIMYIVKMIYSIMIATPTVNAIIY